MHVINLLLFSVALRKAYFRFRDELAKEQRGGWEPQETGERRARNRTPLQPTLAAGSERSFGVLGEGCFLLGPSSEVTQIYCGTQSKSISVFEQCNKGDQMAGVGLPPQARTQPVPT